MSKGIYGASKRATEIIFDALRLELAPFGVKSVTVVTGPVKSLVHSHQDQWKVPENSLYIEVEDAIVKRSAGEDGAPRQDPMVYAAGVVDKLLKGNDPKIWAGGNIGIIKFIANWIPQSLQVCALCLTKVGLMAKCYRTGCLSRGLAWT
jgi:NAD(P)-dependent dehydrogenase (short-subunit alcohol dehydrogenase family)